MINRILAVVMLSLLLVSGAVAAGQDTQSKLNPVKAQEARKYPQIVLYSVSWCPHCREAKEYLAKNNIPFSNRDVEQDAQAMTLLTGKYKSQSIPVIVFGTGPNEIVMHGFTPQVFQENLGKAQAMK
ncbi:MAG: glutaredoxin domain-containing protein [Oryzomonas sp.]|uniref:glutaredoxin domain-containing protein n=1 Tax=Oryzomonas sp. TaxID=2855186 RepID=UPI00284C88CE|nr:glutaredoxin domain-containing protein [Oryzomonas sp.]MDR3578387.1 glutaredoxin domain-containing protein [Oryzomonas sp.]